MKHTHHLNYGWCVFPLCHSKGEKKKALFNSSYIYIHGSCTAEVKIPQNTVRGVQNQTLSIYDIERQQTLLEHCFEVKNGSKIDQKLTKNRVQKVIESELKVD